MVQSQEEPLRYAAAADVAQLVERNLAKVEVAGSRPVIRSGPNTVVVQEASQYGEVSCGLDRYLRRCPSGPRERPAKPYNRGFKSRPALNHNYECIRL